MSTLLELHEERVACAVLEISAENADEEQLRKERGEWLDAEIKRRLTAVDGFLGSEASQIKKILGGVA